MYYTYNSNQSLNKFHSSINQNTFNNFSYFSRNVFKPEHYRNFSKPTPMNISTRKTVPRNPNLTLIIYLIMYKNQTFLSEELFNFERNPENYSHR